MQKAFLDIKHLEMIICIIFYCIFPRKRLDESLIVSKQSRASGKKRKHNPSPFWPQFHYLVPT